MKRHGSIQQKRASRASLERTLRKSKIFGDKLLNPEEAAQLPLQHSWPSGFTLPHHEDAKSQERQLAPVVTVTLNIPVEFGLPVRLTALGDMTVDTA